MTEHKLYLKNSQQLLLVVTDLRESGSRQGTDFDFSWHLTQYENVNFSFNVIEESHGKFKFYTEEWATWFALKYL